MDKFISINNIYLNELVHYKKENTYKELKKIELQIKQASFFSKIKMIGEKVLKKYQYQEKESLKINQKLLENITQQQKMLLKSVDVIEQDQNIKLKEIWKKLINLKGLIDEYNQEIKEINYKKSDLSKLLEIIANEIYQDLPEYIINLPTRRYSLPYLIKHLIKKAKSEMMEIMMILTFFGVMATLKSELLDPLTLSLVGISFLIALMVSAFFEEKEIVKTEIEAVKKQVQLYLKTHTHKIIQTFETTLLTEIKNQTTQELAKLNRAEKRLLASQTNIQQAQLTRLKLLHKKVQQSEQLAISSPDVENPLEGEKQRVLIHLNKTKNQWLSLVKLENQKTMIQSLFNEIDTSINNAKALQAIEQQLLSIDLPAYQKVLALSQVSALNDFAISMEKIFSLDNKVIMPITAWHHQLYLNQQLLDDIALLQSRLIDENSVQRKTINRVMAAINQKIQDTHSIEILESWSKLLKTKTSHLLSEDLAHLLKTFNIKQQDLTNLLKNMKKVENNIKLTKQRKQIKTQLSGLPFAIKNGLLKCINQPIIPLGLTELNAIEKEIVIFNEQYKLLSKKNSMLFESDYFPFLKKSNPCQFKQVLTKAAKNFKQQEKQDDTVDLIAWARNQQNKKGES